MSLSNQTSRLEVFTLISLLMIFGAANTIILKLQTKQKVNGQEFSHPYIQGCVMFLGESICIFVFLLKLHFKKAREQRKPKNSEVDKPKIPVRLIALPASLDFIATNISYIALNMLSSSVWQLLKGGSIVTAAIFVRLIIKQRFTRLKLIGCILTVVGITVVGVSVVAFQNNQDEGIVLIQQEAIGITLVVVSLIFTGLQVTYQQKLFRSYSVDVFQMVGMEGIFGLAMNLLLVLILSFVPNPWHHTSSPYMQSFPEYFSSLRQSMVLLILAICQIFSMAISIVVAVTITKRINSVSRSIVNVARGVLVWIFGLIMTFTIEDKLESTNIGQIITELLGFIFVIGGTVVYHRKKGEIPENQQLLKSQITDDLSDGTKTESDTRDDTQGEKEEPPRDYINTSWHEKFQQFKEVRGP